MRRYSVTLPDGQRASVHACYYDEGPVPRGFVAPDASGRTPFATIDRGSNYHGSLAEEFYVTTDKPAYTNAVVLWVADSGSQWDDNVPRLWPVAWCGCDSFIAFSGRLENEAVISEILLYAFARHGIAYCDAAYDPLEHIISGSVLLSDAEIADVLDLAAAGKAYRDANAEKLSRRQATRGIYVSVIEDPYPRAPALLGMLCEGEVEQIAFHDEMQKAVRAGGFRMGDVETEIRGLIDRCKQEDRKVIGFTRKVLRVARQVGLEEELLPYFRDGHKIGRTWIQLRHRAGIEDATDSYDPMNLYDNEPEPAWTLDMIAERGIGAAVPTSASDAGEKLRTLRYEIAGETRRKTLTDKARKRWRRILDGNDGDCEVLREITLQATTELAQLRKASA